MESFDRPLCRNDTFSPFDRPPLQGNFCASQSAAVTKVKGWPPFFLYSIPFRTLPARTIKPPVLPSPSPLFGEGGGGRRFFKGEAPRQAFRKKSLERGKKGGGQMSEETKQERKPEWWESGGLEPMGWKVTEEEIELALKKLWAGLDW